MMDIVSKRSFPKMLRACALYAIIGVALNVAVAWLCAALTSGSGTPLSVIGARRGNDHMWKFIRFDAIGSTFVYSDISANAGWFADTEADPITLCPYWCDPTELAALPFGSVHSFLARGLPFRSL